MDAAKHSFVKRLEGIFMPYAAARREALRKAKKRMVHYTSAENLFKIISSQSMWMRNASCMSDYSEVVHGHQLLLKFFQTQERRDELYSALNACHPGVAEEGVGLFDSLFTNLRFNSYICSISEHEDTEDLHGRLSMWRAFGRTSARAAMVLNIPEEGDAEALRLLLSPVAYFGYDQVEKQLRDVTANVVANRDFLAGIERNRLKDLIFITLASAAVSIKHEGFQEEKEWRVVYLPDVLPSPLIRSTHEIVEGVPQPVFHIPLRKDPANNVIGLSIPALVDRIIIGPTVYPAAMHMAFANVLGQLGVPEPFKKVVVSNIPIRP